MKKAFLIVFAAVFWTSCSKNEPVGPEAGKAYYQALNCRACHAVGADGGTSGPDLTYAGFRRSKAWLDQWLQNPQGWKPDTMMPNPHLSDKARGGVVEYLATLKGQDFGAHAAWTGHDVYVKAGCIACHGAAGAGGYPNNNVKGGKIPALNLAATTYTKDELIKKISRGVKPEKADPNGPDPLVFMPPWGEVLKPEEIAAAADYLMSLKSANAQDAGF